MRDAAALLCVSLTFLAVLWIAAPALAQEPAGTLRPARLRCEHLVAPRGIDVARPRLGWEVQSARRNARQTAYHLRAGTTPGAGDLWDTGRVESGDTVDVEWAGRALASHSVVHWGVRVWDERGAASAWSEPATFTTGFMDSAEWAAEWVGYDRPRVEAEGGRWVIGHARWVGFAGDDPNAASATERFYARAFELPDVAPIESAELTVTGDDAFELAVNGVSVARGSGVDSWRTPQTVDVARQLRAGANEIRVTVRNASVGPSGLLLGLHVRFANGGTGAFATDEKWTCAAWADAAPQPARLIGANGVAPWGNIVSGELLLPPTRLLRTTFDVDAKPLARATLYVTALGNVDAHLDGARVSDERFTPGWTDYRQRVYYRAHDVTAKLSTPGRHALGAELGDGWYSGYIAWGRQRDHYGTDARAALDLRLEYADGTVQHVRTGPDWKAGTGGTREADFLMGERFDAAAHPADWCTAAFDDASWAKVDVGSNHAPRVQWHPSPPVVAHEEFRARKITEPKPGAYVLDFGQNFAGVARLRVEGTKAGQVITVRFAERLDADGTLYMTALRGARCTDTYVCRGDAVETWEPRLTFHGFQYAEITGLTSAPKPDTLVGVALASDTPVVGAFETSDALLNQLARNVYYTQRSNFLEVPTDCPQRDERLGWTADFHVYLPTAALWCDVQPFTAKWLQDLVDAQEPSGQYPKIAPMVADQGDGGPAWADAGTIAPLAFHDAYGDARVLARQYASMKRFVDFCRERSLPDMRPPKDYHCFGDWLSVGVETPKDVVYMTFLAQSARLTARAARALGHEADAARYDALAAQVSDSFRKGYVDADGRVLGDTQAGYVLALQYGLLDDQPKLKAKAAARLIADVEQRGHLTTGFLGTKELLPALSALGRDDLALKLLHNTEYPSWGFSIKHGATSIWERWNGWTPEAGFADAGMNSFAHYSFGSVHGWMVEHLGGLRPRHDGLRVEPLIDPALTFARAAYHGPRGRVETRWERVGGRLTVEVTVPANVRATVKLPAKPADVREGGKALAEVEGVEVRGDEFTVGGGTYKFEMPDPVR